MTRASLAFGLTLLLAGCADTGREFVTVAFEARGTGITAATLGDWDVVLTRADVSIGPLYLCATELASSEFCEEALLERLETVVVRGLDPTPQPLGELAGVTGTVRSATYDLGWSYFLTQAMAAPTEGAVDGHSIVLEGTATRGADVMPFRFDVDVIPQVVGDTAVHGFRTRADVAGPGQRLTIEVDPLTWLGAVDFDALFALQSAPGAEVHVTRGVVGHDAVALGVTTFAPPAFVWTTD